MIIIIQARDHDIKEKKEKNAMHEKNCNKTHLSTRHPAQTHSTRITALAYLCHRQISTCNVTQSSTDIACGDHVHQLWHPAILPV